MCLRSLLGRQRGEILTVNSQQESAARGAENRSPHLVVGIGASAGGIDACKRLLHEMPADLGAAFVIILHLAPAQESHLADIFKGATRMEVTQVTGADRLLGNHVYVIAPATSLRIVDGTLKAGEPHEPHYQARPVDSFFVSLADERKDSAVGIVLSGTGDDGAAGMKAIRAAGGLCLVQDSATAEYDGMPQSASDTGVADAVVPPEAMGEIVRAYAADRSQRPSTDRPTVGQTDEGRADEGRADESSGELDPILRLLEERYGLDFRHYKKGTMERRTERRMGFKRIANQDEYVEYLRKTPEEVEALYNDLLIDVTRFFRDPDEWNFLREDILPDLLQARPRGEPLRIWSTGCATGEEVYSLAMVCLEQLKDTGRPMKLRVFASDVSHEALATARRGSYPLSIEDQVSPERLARFFRRTEQGYEVERILRDVVTFAAHDLLSDPPFAHLDLVSCRNVLIYLQPHAQERLLERFHFALRPGGVLWLGSSETIGRRTELFEARSSPHHFYRATGDAQPPRYRAATWVGTGPTGPGFRGERSEARAGPKVGRLVEQLVLQRFTSASVIINRSLETLYFFGPTEDYLTRPQGQARMDLLSWVRPGLYAKLRTGLTEAIEQRATVTFTAAHIEPKANNTQIEVTIEPITGVPAEGLFAVIFRDIPRPSGVQETLVEDGTMRDAVLAQLGRELDDTREELKTVVEQLKIANEDYHAGHEELLSLNEEFQSSNEELETSKEELQSLNEELTTINRQLEERNTELRAVNTDLNNLLVSTDVPTIFLNGQLRIRRFTPACTEVMRIVPTDIDRSLENIKMRVHDENILADAERVLRTAEPVEVEVAADHDRWFVRKALPYRTEDGEVDGVCLTFQDITAQKRSVAASENARLFAESIIKTSRTPLLVLDRELCVRVANRAFYDAFRVKKEETEGRRIYELGNRQWDIPAFRRLLDEVLPSEREVRNYDLEHTFEDIGWRVMRLNANAMKREGRTALILVSIEDVTDLRQAEIAAEKRAEELLEEHRRKDEFLAMLGHELRNPLGALSSGLEVMSTASDPSRVEHLRLMMVRQIRRMTAMLDQLLDVARVVSGKFVLEQEAVNVADAARSAIETLTPLLESRKQQLTVSLPDERTAVVLGDAVRLAQVIENLLGNAIKYTESGGRIWLTVGATDGTVRLSVRDTGIGMEPHLLEHAFELFTQAPVSLDRAQGGLGLGLALVRTLVQMHKGEITAHSPGPGHGSEFVMTLPRLRTRDIMQAPGAKPAHRLRGAFPARVLVVDDEEDAAQMLAELLSSQGHEARSAHDGPTALQAAREFRPHIVLLDLGLPNMDGYEVARRLRAEHSEPMILVAMTGYQRDKDRLEESGFDEHLLKPVDFEKLAALFDKRDTDHAALKVSHVD